MSRPTISSTDPASAATQSSAKAIGDEDEPDRARRAFAATKPLNGVAPHCRHLAKSRPRSALPSRRGLEFMFEAQVKAYIKRLGDVRLALADGRPFYACGARNLRATPLNENRNLFPRLPPMRRDANEHGPHEIYQWPTKCSSTRPIRRRPGWWFCAATASRNSTLNPRTASN